MDYTTTKAWQDGVKRALEQIALQPPDDFTTTVSLDDRYHDPFLRSHFKLCNLCGWARGSRRCPHDARGVVAQ